MPSLADSNSRRYRSSEATTASAAVGFWFGLTSCGRFITRYHPPKTTLTPWGVNPINASVLVLLHQAGHYGMGVPNNVAMAAAMRLTASVRFAGEPAHLVGSLGEKAVMDAGSIHPGNTPVPFCQPGTAERICPAAPIGNRAFMTAPGELSDHMV